MMRGWWGLWMMMQVRLQDIHLGILPSLVWRKLGIVKWEEGNGSTYGNRGQSPQQVCWQFVHILFLSVNSVEQE